jgi:hypothetical protein
MADFARRVFNVESLYVERLGIRLPSLAAIFGPAVPVPLTAGAGYAEGGKNAARANTRTSAKCSLTMVTRPPSRPAGVLACGLA